MKWEKAAGILLGLVILALFALLFIKGPKLLLYRTEAPMAEVQKALEKADCVNIVEVLGMNNQSVLQCGVDYARDLGALGKKVEVYAFEGNTCYTLDGAKPSPLCVVGLLTSSCPILYIHGENKTNSYKDLLLVGVGKDYEVGQCSILVNGKPAFEYIMEKKAREGNETGVSEMGANETEANTTGTTSEDGGAGNTTEGERAENATEDNATSPAP